MSNPVSDTQESDGDSGRIENSSAALADPITQAVEALIFASDRPIPRDRVADVIDEVNGLIGGNNKLIDESVAALNTCYKEEGRAFRIEKWAGGYRMATISEVAPYLKSHFREEKTDRLSRSLMEALAVVAYRQPVTRPEVDFVRGVNSDYALRKLLDLGLVDVVGRSDSVGRPLVYGTTAAFLEQFGLSTLEDLPTLREIEELLDDPQFNREKAQMLLVEGLATAEGTAETAESNAETVEDSVETVEDGAERVEDSAETTNDSNGSASTPPQEAESQRNDSPE